MPFFFTSILMAYEYYMKNDLIFLQACSAVQLTSER